MHYHFSFVSSFLIVRVLGYNVDHLQSADRLVGGTLLDGLVPEVEVPLGLVYISSCISKMYNEICESSGMGVKLTVDRNVEALAVLANLLDSLDSLVVELNLLKVGTDARGGDRLGDDTGTSNLGPSEDDLGASDGLAVDLGEALGGGDDVGVVDEEREVLAVVAKGGVGGDVDAFGGAVGDELFLLETGVTLNLVGGGDNTSFGDEDVDLGRGSQLVTHSS